MSAKNNLIKKARIGYMESRSEKGDPWYSFAELNINGYIVMLDYEYCETLDAATTRLKDRIARAVGNFAPVMS